MDGAAVVTLLGDRAALQGRAAAAAGPLRPLADSLADDLAPLVARAPEVPATKAWLSRAGGRCPRDGAMLDFHPFAPHDHRCPRCGELYRGALHDRWWITWYQLWLAERAVHAALLAAVRPAGAAAHGALADHVLASCADRYLSYPNRDNALGPTRPFFSTYLESIWLLQLAIALDLREASGASAAGPAIRAALVEPSARLIAGFDEGASNRQVWHNAALLAAARLLDDPGLAERAVFGRSGLVSHLEGGLLADGSWYEGENYHLFAHRGLWYGVQLSAAAGIALPPALLARFDDGFATPFVTALPDLTFPARRDSQYGVSLRQWRFAELCELGLARRDDPRLTGTLAGLYADDVPRGDPGRWRSTAEAERNEPASALGRADLGWRSLLCARAFLPPLEPLPARSALLEGQGLAVFRREAGQAYAALDYGHSGGGHGHPDRLNVLLAAGGVRWLDDMGTGSYVDPSLHWYRSTLAHNAPLFDGRSQQREHGVLEAYEERPAAGWADATVDGLGPGVRTRRALVVMDQYLVTELSWVAEAPAWVDLPFHVGGELADVNAWQADAPLAGADPGADHGWRYLTRAERASGSPLALPVRLAAERDGRPAVVWLLAPPDAALWRAIAPGPPGTGERRFHWVRAYGRAGTITLVWSWAGAVAAVAAVAREGAAGVQVTLADGSRHEHARSAHGWHIGLLAGGARSSIDLGGRRTRGVAGCHDGRGPAAAPRPAAAPAIPPLTRPLAFELGEPHYRRSEASWSEADCPRARVELGIQRARLVVRVVVPRSSRAFRPAIADNPLDNEPADTNGDGVQLYVEAPDGRLAAWILVPELIGDGRVRVTPASQSTVALPLEAAWRTVGDAGYELSCEIPLVALCGAGAAGGPARPCALRLDVVVNETTRERERRRGQLVLSGGAGEFVYLRGDRQAAERLLPFVIADV